MALPGNGALFGDTVRAAPFRSAAGGDTRGLPRVDAAAGFAVPAGPAGWQAARPAALLACCAPTEVAVLGPAGAPPALIELLVRRASSRTDTA
jgi:hypothetical protein